MYLFQEPLRLYWKENAATQENQAGQGGIDGRKGAEAPSLVQGVDVQPKAKEQP